jgi:hypothetical protein
VKGVSSHLQKIMNVWSLSFQNFVPQLHRLLLLCVLFPSLFFYKAETKNIKQIFSAVGNKISFLGTVALSHLSKLREQMFLALKN